MAADDARHASELVSLAGHAIPGQLGTKCVVFPRCLSRCGGMWKVRTSLIAGADWSNAPPVPLARCSALSTFPKTIFIHCTLSRHSSGTVTSVSSFSSTKIPYKSTLKQRKTHTKLCWSHHKVIVDLHKWWKVMFESPPVATSLGFPPSQKQRPTYPVGFFPSPPSLGRLYRRDRPVRLRSAPLRRLIHFPHAQWRLRYSGGWKREKPAWGMGERVLWRRQRE